MYATVTNSSEIRVVNRSTGATTTVLTAPNGATGLNQIGLAGDGSKLFLTNSANVYEYTAATEAWEVTPRTGPAVANTMGGVDPVSGLFYFGGQSVGNTFTFTTYNPTTNAVGTSTITVTADNPPGGNGDIAFDSLGNLYFVSSGSQLAQVYRVDAAQLGAGTATATRVGPAINAGLALNSMAFADDGYLYIAGSGTNGFLRVNPITGAVLERRSLNAAITDLGTNAVPYTGSASINLPGGRVNPTDQFTVTVGGGGISTGNTATTTGTNTSATVGPLLLLPGETFTIEQKPVGATDPSNYTTTWQCVDPVTGAVVATGTGSTGSFTLPANVRNVACTFTSTAIAQTQPQDDESLNNKAGTPVTVDVTGNDRGDLNPGSVRIINGDGNPVTELAVPGQGTWAVNTTTGAITFTPENGFTGNPAPITYQVTDTRGNTVNADVTIAYAPAAADDESLNNKAGTAVTVDVTGNDRGDLNPGSVRIINGDGNPVTELAVPGQGTWAVNTTTGAITFTPENGFTGNPAPITYQVTDTRGNTVNADVTIAYAPAAADDESLNNKAGTAVTVDVTGNDQGDLNPGSVRIINGDGNPVTELAVPGQGTWTVNTTTGAITFTPENSFTGNPAPITYQVTDTRGNTVNADVTITYAPAAENDESLNNKPGTPATGDSGERAPAKGGQPLASTGAQVGVAAALGLGLLGAGLVLTLRRRQQA
ncbi:LPXTG cell wall anchor domain-containing protein [Pseudarthrobacter sp. NamB4]|uniref:Ig-like domain-containing protein n=1 Tax=Pseudarthrobacter sp. NamB4 TaxID=2576837 RepID=UPI0010FE8720|nr:LPXTG cell wall anchor domain-containing protein [Pseudarthrobacter sp. NamB4]TLM70894.1 LPXTG cell wall anchor domain-containing protein [Pseudarthrobacter sp. NamB4]